jgi:hypothetical protein
MSGKSCRYAFIEFFDAHCAQRAVAHAHASMLAGFKLVCNLYATGATAGADAGLSRTPQSPNIRGEVSRNVGAGESTTMDAATCMAPATALLTAVNASATLRIRSLPARIDEGQIAAIFGPHGKVVSIEISPPHDGGAMHADVTFASAVEAHRAYTSFYGSAVEANQRKPKTSLEVTLVSADIDGIPPPYVLLLTPPHPRLSQLQAETGAALVVRPPHLTADHRIPQTGGVAVWSAPSTLPLALRKLRWLRPTPAVAPLLLKIRNEPGDFAAVVAAAFRPGTPAGRPEVRRPRRPHCCFVSS